MESQQIESDEEVFVGSSDAEFVVEIVRCADCKKQASEVSLLLIDWIEGSSKAFYLCEACTSLRIIDENAKSEKNSKQILEVQAHIVVVEEMIIQTNSLLDQAQKDSEEKNFSQLRSLEEEQVKAQQNLEEKLETLKVKVLDFEKQELQYWDDVNVFEKRLQNLLQKRQIAKQLEEQSNERLNRLNKYNTINSVFYIEVSEQVGLINGLAIGKKLNEDIIWEETNAGLGQVALLMSHLSAKFGYVYKTIKDIEVCGNESFIWEKTRSEQLYLKGPILNRVDEGRFVRTMRLLLEELDGLAQHIIALKDAFPDGTTLELPFKIDTGFGTVDGLALSTQQGSTSQYKGIDNWTQAFKKLLINLKYLVSLNAIFDAKKETELLVSE